MKFEMKDIRSKVEELAEEIVREGFARKYVSTPSNVHIRVPADIKHFNSNFVLDTKWIVFPVTSQGLKSMRRWYAKAKRWEKKWKELIGGEE